MRDCGYYGKWELAKENDSVETWCKNQNKQNNNATLSIALFCGGVILCMAAFVEHNLIYGLLGSVILAVFYFVVPPYLSVKRYFAITDFGRAPIMPDSLLSHLADDPEIPLSAKRAIASKLAEDSLIDFRFLAEVDADLHYDAKRHAREENDGFKKMSAYNSIEDSGRR